MTDKLTELRADNTPQSIVTSLEWSKKLKEAGWPQDQEMTVFHWRGPVTHLGRPCWSIAECIDTHAKENFAAPTAEEILQEIPQELLKIRLRIIHEKNKWVVGYGFALHDNDEPIYCSDPSLVDAAAKLWLYLKQNKLLPSES